MYLYITDYKNNTNSIIFLYWLEKEIDSSECRHTQVYIWLASSVCVCVQYCRTQSHEGISACLCLFNSGVSKLSLLHNPKSAFRQKSIFFYIYIGVLSFYYTIRRSMLYMLSN